MTKRGRFTNIQHKHRLIIALSLIALAYAIKYGTVKVLHWVVRTQLEFVEGSYHYRMWQTNVHPYNVEFYFYNWTNSNELHNRSVKPHFEELGPYHFELYINRTDIRIHEHNDTVSYSFTKRFVHVQRESDRRLDDVITTLNPVANALAYHARHWSTFVKFGASLALRATKSEVSVKKTVRELLFEGYDDALLELAKRMPNLASEQLGMQFKDRFGYFYKRNYTDLYFGPYNVHVKVNADYGDLHTINGRTATPYFPGACGRVAGKLGEYSDPEHERSKPIIVYVHDLHVSTRNYFREERMINGVVGSVYAPKDYIFDNGTFEKTNECFCSGECVPVGMLNSSAAFMQAPIFMSLPHFLLADASYQDGVDITYQSARGNQSWMPYIAVEQSTGLLLEGALNIQLNLLLQPVKGLGLFSDVPRVFMPVFAMKQHIVTRGAYLELLALLQKTPLLINCLSFIALMLGVGMLLLLRFAPRDNTAFYREYRQVPPRT